MIVLGIDTTTRFLCLGIDKDGQIYETNLDLGIKHSEKFFPELKLLLKKAGISVKDIQCLAVSIGPGSFTGIRIGLAAAKGLSIGLQKPLVALSSLDILARNAADKKGLICPVIDAKRGLLFSSVYTQNAGRLKRITCPQLISGQDLLKCLDKKKKIIFLGDGLLLYKHLFSDKLKTSADFLEPNKWYPRASHVLALAEDLIKKNRFCDALTVKPIYLYPKECQIRIKK